MPDDEGWTQLAVPHRAVKPPHANTEPRLGCLSLSISPRTWLLSTQTACVPAPARAQASSTTAPRQSMDLLS